MDGNPLSDGAEPMALRSAETSDRDYASGVVARALRKGVLRRPAYCSVCRHNTSSHNPIVPVWEDYDDPMSVRWACRRCAEKQRQVR